ncbi:DUF1707 domain-containing protein [uncultured Corynebacterium sp.]|uniref:DUF1707 SHOCT-like domain-containing protein n=1 Tax=uncultured Corynebacterium sp. TaxID=159447 RepID=UPI0025D12D66|nr:DUF1707 domain-containing protein [uncultured Corynebacterium sp.]
MTPPMNSSDDPRPIRATDDERRRVVDALSQALGHGQLDLSEFDERTSAVWDARTRDELTEPLADLMPDPMTIIDGRPGAHPGSPAPAVRPDAQVAGPAGPSARDLAAVANAHVTGEKHGSSFSVAVMFGSDQGGDWICPAKHYSFAMMGGIGIDLRQARFESRHTEIVAVALMGGIEIIVPEDMRLSVQGTGVMGGFGSSNSKEVVVAGHDLPDDAPSVRVTGVAMMGGVDVIRKPRSER